ncbi:DNA repair protein RadA [Schleiferilactobacillus perolens]|uniref:DNA repair protein RadA n=1 Tax=Schleiferilactobacillus perolens TaxID=100468 RepID=UPI002354FDB1|nr:DNA repair protein RadA [Schleiferilactobacillus perolens]MCI1891308.1 DNA repair protein RadA [Schleiferilactobacillus harbinensis]MCI1912746.1 DNA repair protein RadA [Schleiferilactobacillus harbinensis]MCI2170169.1 DNA repair protein RadA [Schleiferilactobacillus perolens]
MAKAKTHSRYVCQNCGYTSPQYFGRCPNCGAWNQMVEEIVSTNTQRVGGAANGIHSAPVALDAVDLTENKRIPTKLNELNRVLGGGVVPGSLILIGGDPGIGKSTLLMQVSGQLADSSTDKVLYVSGEESASQIRLRAERLGVRDHNVIVYPETDMDLIRQAIKEVKPAFLVIDSVQTMNEPALASASGSVSQIREVTSELMKIAKNQGITTFVIGHVTKDGAIAGPKVLEHMVDTVLYFEGDMHHTYRILRTVKNRYGSTNEIGIFSMEEDGLREVANPSESFLEERLPHATGSAIVVSMEGTRPILVEIQALMSPTLFGNAKRTTTGLDHNRAALIMAVLEKRANLLLQNQDAYLKATGGVKLDEPAIDLAMAVAIASSYQDAEVDPGDCFVGEIGLTGEIRRVNRIETRIAEAAKLGFKRIFVPKNNLAKYKPTAAIEVVGVATINECLQQVLNQTKTMKGGRGA